MLGLFADVIASTKFNYVGDTLKKLIRRVDVLQNQEHSRLSFCECTDMCKLLPVKWYRVREMVHGPCTISHTTAYTTVELNVTHVLLVS